MENGRLDCGDYHGEALIRKLASVLDADEDKLPVPAQKVPDRIRRWALERPDAFGRLALLGDRELDLMVAQIRE